MEKLHIFAAQKNTEDENVQSQNRGLDFRTEISR